MSPLQSLRSAVSFLCAACVVGFTGSSAALDDPSNRPERARRREAVIVGSSSVRGSFGRIIAHDLTRKGYHVIRKGVVSAGLARPDYRDMRKLIDELPIDEQTAAVFVYLGVNDGQSLWLRPSERTDPDREWLSWRDERWASVYLLRSWSLYESLCQRGAKRVVVLLPVEVQKPSLERRLERIRELQTEAASRSSCAIAISTDGESEDFTVEGEPTRLRDGFHMSPVGAKLVWERVKRRALREAPQRARWAL